MCNICSVCKQKTLKNKGNTIIYTEIKMLQTNSENIKIIIKLKIEILMLLPGLPG